MQLGRVYYFCVSFGRLCDIFAETHIKIERKKLQEYNLFLKTEITLFFTINNNFMQSMSIWSIKIFMKKKDFKDFFLSDPGPFFSRGLARIRVRIKLIRIHLYLVHEVVWPRDCRRSPPAASPAVCSAPPPQVYNLRILHHQYADFT